MSFSMLNHYSQVIRSSGFRPYFFVTGCCSVEIDIARSSVYDLSRLGVRVVDKPAQADVLFVGGWINSHFEKRIRMAYEELQSPKYVIAVGTCAITGASYISDDEKKLIDEILPVDVYVSGCPPGVESYVEALMELRRKVSPTTDQRTVLGAAIKTGPVQV